MTRINLFSLILIGALGYQSSLMAEVFKVKNCKVTFETTGEPVLVKILGKSEAPCEGQATIEGGAVKDSSFTMDLNKLDTGIGLRNKHLRENYLHTDKFPSAGFKISKITDFDLQKAGTKKDNSKFEGTLDLHGTQAPVAESNYQIKGKQVTAQFEIDLPNWKVEKPSFMGVKIVDKVHLTVNFEI